MLRAERRSISETPRPAAPGRRARYTASMPTPTVTTVKVTTDVRDQLNAGARARNVTVNEYVRLLLAEREREERLSAVGRAMAAAGDDYWSEVAEIEAIGYTVA